MKIKLLNIINNLLTEAVIDAGTLNTHKAYQAKVKIEYVKWLSSKYRDNTIVVDNEAEYELFLEERPSVKYNI